jgi:hypothetical protein
MQFFLQCIIRYEQCGTHTTSVYSLQWIIIEIESIGIPALTIDVLTGLPVLDEELLEFEGEVRVCTVLFEGFEVVEEFLVFVVCFVRTRSYIVFSEEIPDYLDKKWNDKENSYTRLRAGPLFDICLIDSPQRLSI